MRSTVSYRAAKAFARGYLCRKLTDEDFRPVYDEWCAYLSNSNNKKWKPLAEFIWEKYYNERGEGRTEEIKPIPLVTDTFAQCEICHMWDRLAPVDETNERTIPLLQSHYVGKKWLCNRCWDEAEEKGWGVVSS